MSPNGIALSLYLGIITIGVVYTCLGWGLRKLPAPTVVTLTLAEPTTAAILATAVLHQSVGMAGWIGIAVVLVALFLTASGAGSEAEVAIESRLAHLDIPLGPSPAS